MVCKKAAEKMIEIENAKKCLDKGICPGCGCTLLTHREEWTKSSNDWKYDKEYWTGFRLKCKRCGKKFGDLTNVQMDYCTEYDGTIVRFSA